MQKVTRVPNQHGHHRSLAVRSGMGLDGVIDRIFATYPQGDFLSAQKTDSSEIPPGCKNPLLKRLAAEARANKRVNCLVLAESTLAICSGCNNQALRALLQKAQCGLTSSPHA